MQAAIQNAPIRLVMNSLAMPPWGGTNSRRVLRSNHGQECVGAECPITCSLSIDWGSWREMIQRSGVHRLHTRKTGWIEKVVLDVSDTEGVTVAVNTMSLEPPPPDDKNWSNKWAIICIYRSLSSMPCIRKMPDYNNISINCITMYDSDIYSYTVITVILYTGIQ